LSTRLDQLIASSRERDVAWDVARAERVRAGALRQRAARNGRDRLLRRGALVVGGAGLLVLALLRAASSAPAEIAASASPAPSPAPTAEMIAARALGDGGYARD
jgi:hypothetical protein